MTDRSKTQSSFGWSFGSDSSWWWYYARPMGASLRMSALRGSV